ncbi:SUMF1/EgtB/PvdO family nonheme iron enzyme [Rubritalea spongiae]|uniref:SUMF1/EgtB/PvdO family nonheme iron enzyme n=1 Tax=Rubritalea spongiae TaxID=430797 RepID=A0ABW5E3L8_9BACT
MTSKPILEVHIPDHEVLRKIGGGAYGEVWLARGVTGAWRAVKVVWREDFDDERGFEREFEGILKYEPISRDHPGLVNILHVGRSKEGQSQFYYYVMELGDDFHTGVEINPVEYEARTLRSDLVTAGGEPLDIDFCLDVAFRLSDALAYLHERDLAHRDVKPSNVIFVGGKAKLADIGLVAVRDQRTFVGTEGFVPPEGPGSSQADLYSLGKVLYEMVTGKDRLQFPELPDELPQGSKRKLWLEMNQVICDICEPKQAKRTITTAPELAETFQRLQQGKKVRKKRGKIFAKGIAACLVVAALAGGVQFLLSVQKKKNAARLAIEVVESVEAVENSNRPENEICSLKVVTYPPYAKVYENGVLLEEGTPTDFRDFEPGEVVTYRFELDGYKTLEKNYTVPDAKIRVIEETLSVYRPPVQNLIWTDPLGENYSPRDGYHISGFVRRSAFEQFKRMSKTSPPHQYTPFSESGESIQIVLTNEATAESYAEWLERLARRKGLLGEHQMMTHELDPDLLAANYTGSGNSEEKLPMRMIVKDIPYSTVALTSEPEGARVYVNKRWVGSTPIELKRIRPGMIQVELRAEGYKKFQKTYKVGEGGKRELFAELKPNDGLIFGEQWKNSLGMPLVPIREGFMAAAWETRVDDYAVFLKETGHKPPRGAGYSQAGDHPVVGVNLGDAEAFCAWLTKRELADERISEGHRYKIPSDLEWSELAGLFEDPEASPSDRDLEAQNTPDLAEAYFWDGDFPPVDVVANLADESAALAVGVSKSRTIDGYEDGYEKTAPVGSFQANQDGLYDLCGNVYEWVSTPYNEGQDLAVVRGGSWASFSKSHLRVWSRFLISKSLRANQFGFRVILVDESQKTE